MNPKTAIDTQVRGRVRVEHGTKRIRAFLVGLISFYTDKVALYVDGVKQS